MKLHRKLQAFHSLNNLMEAKQIKCDVSHSQRSLHEIIFCGEVQMLEALDVKHLV